MKKQFIVSFVLMLGIGQNAFSQTVIPHDIPCFDITPDNVDTLPSGIHALDCITADGATIDFNADQNYSIRAGEYIQFDENTVIIPDASHTFHAYIQKEDLDLAWYYPNATPGTVGRYEKLELGAHFVDTTIQQKIENFVKNQTGDKLNPFNPEEIDLYAEFWVLVGDPLGDGESWVGPKRVNGFYYEEFARSADTIHWDTIPNPDNFRIRYAPPMTGTWRCKVSAVVAGYGTLTVSEFTFDCVGSDNKGFVRAGDNGRYLRVGSEPFFPVGQNLTGPNDSIREAEYKDHPVSAFDYVRFHGTMTELADNGANYFRYIVAPWQTEIEFEHLGNYSNRMTNAWEFDKILDTAKALDLKIHYDMQIHYAFEVPNGFTMTFWDWSAKGDPLSPHYAEDAPCFRDNDSGYCYRNELGIINPLDFLTNTTAMSFYKRRLRYMIARWGYSTEIGVMELLSEANNFGGECLLEDTGSGCSPHSEDDDPENITTHPYHDEPGTIAPDLMAWQIEMCRYIKEDLGHYEHPLAVDYTGTPEGDLPTPNYLAGDFTFYSPYIDITNYNYYGLAVNKAELNFGHVKLHRDRFYSFGYVKPIMNPEYGANAETWTCDHSSGYIHRVCLTPFTGVAGSAMSWDEHWNEMNSWRYLRPIREFMEGVPLDEGEWSEQWPIVMDDKSVEILYLRNVAPQGDTKIIGAISNRRFNYWSVGDTTLGCIDGDNEPSEIIYRSSLNYTDSHLGSEMKFSLLGPNNNFKVDFYNALTGEYVGTKYPTSNVWGNLVLDFPGILTGDSISPILFFKFYPADGTFLAPMKIEETATELPMSFRKTDELQPLEPTPWHNLQKNIVMSISPNPTTGAINCSILGEFDGLHWVLTQPQGGQLASNNIISPNFIIDLSVYANGIYYVSLQNANGQIIQTQKIIKQ